MSRKKFFFFFVIIFCINVFAQSNISNNKITINGNVYYYSTSSTSSSPQPKIRKSGFVSEGSWYGEEAARAWSSISRWTIENCQNADPPINLSEGEKVYIHQVHAYRNRTPKGIKYIFGTLSSASYYTRCSAAVVIYYWVVPENVPMEHGRREYRRFWFY